MDFFEFLIQREGDRSWLPVESSETEILEGRYRIMGRSPYVNQPVHIRISYLDLESIPPRRRMHKRTSRTNDKGLVAILPFTALRNGKWGVQCLGVSPEPDAKRRWQHKIQLQVLEDNAHHVADFEPEYAADAPGMSAQATSIHVTEGQTQRDEQALGDVQISSAEMHGNALSWSAEQPQDDDQTRDREPNQWAEGAARIQNPNPTQDGAWTVEEAQDEDQNRVADEQPASAYEGAHLEKMNAAPTWAVPGGVPIDLESLSPDIRDDIAQVFQTVDAMAEDILASIGVKMAEMSGVQRNVQQKPNAGHGAESTADPDVAQANGSSVPQQQFPGLQLILDQEAWCYEGDRPLTITGRVQSLKRGNVHHEFPHLLLSMQLTDPQNGAVLGEITQPLHLSQEGATAFCLTLETIHPTQAHVVLGEVLLAIPVAPGKASQASDLEENHGATHQSLSGESGIIIASQAFVVTVALDSLLGTVSLPPTGCTADAKTQPASNSNSVSLPPLDPPLPFVEPTEQPAASGHPEPPEPRPFRVSDQPTLPPKIHGDSPGDESSSAKPRPPLDLPDFVKSPTSLASSLLGLAGLSSDAQDRVGKFPSDESNDAQAHGDDPHETADEITSGSGSGQDPDAWLERLMQELKQAEQADESGNHASADPFAVPSSEDDRTAVKHPQENSSPEADSKTENPFAEAVWELEATANLTDPEEVDPFDLLDESEMALGQTSPSASDPSGHASNGAGSVPSHLAQQFIPDYADDPSDFEFHLESSMSPSSGMGERAEILAEDDPWVEDIGTRSGSPGTYSANPPFTPSDRVSPSSPAHRPQNGAYPTPAAGNSPDRADSLELERYSVFPDDVEIPTPTLECMDEELVAGQAFRITAKIPDLGPRVFVKLWIQDRQTRTLLDGPRWLADFIPGDEGTLEARTQLTIPLGAVEVRVEAIAMEMMTQRESRKVSVDKTVVPPDMPAFSLDDL